MYKGILVPIDGSDTGRRSLKEVIALVTGQKATQRVLQARESLLPVLVRAASTVS